MNRVIHKHACACPSCQRARFRLLCGGYRDITPTPFPRQPHAWRSAMACRLEDASGYGVLLIAAASVLAIDALFWFSFGWQYWFAAAILCGLVACSHRRSPWPLLGALAAFVALGLAAHLALGLFFVAARVWTALMGVPA